MSWMSLGRKERAKDRDRERDKDSVDDMSLQRTTTSSTSTPRSSFMMTRSQSLQSVHSATFTASKPIELDTSSSPSPISSPTPPRRASSPTSLQGLTELLPQDAPSQNEPDSSTTVQTFDSRPTAVLSNASSSSDLAPTPPCLNSHSSSGSGTFSKYSLTSVLTLGLVRDKTEEGERGRSTAKSSGSTSRRSSLGNQDSDRSRSRGRSTSPFRFRSRSKGRRDASPSSMVEALSLDADSDSDAAPRMRPRNAFNMGDDSDDDDSDASEESWSDADIGMDELTAQHTEANAAVPSHQENMIDTETAEPDPLGEGVNVIIPSEPYFPSTQFSSPHASGLRSNPKRRKSTRVERDLLPMETSRPQFARNRCTITLTHGDPEKALDETKRSGRTYIVCSDLSEESRYAVEWGIGTVLRDGDVMMVVNVTENESKLDPADGSQVDRLAKLRSQQDRQTLAFLLVKQVTGLLQRTKLHVKVQCQAWHAKNARHTLLDIIDYKCPTMVIVGSRGLTRLKGILLGSTSHYLIQKSSVPVMVARRRLKRPAKKSAHLTPHRARVSLAEAAIDKVGPGTLDKEVEELRDELQRDDAAREAVDLRRAGTDRGLAEEHEVPDMDDGI